MKKTLITLIALGVIGTGAWHIYQKHSEKMIDDQIEKAEELILTWEAGEKDGTVPRKMPTGSPFINNGQ